MTTLDVLGSTRAVVEVARSVRIDYPSVRTLADRLAKHGPVRPVWRKWPHWWEGGEATANYVLVLDTLNYSFWGDPRWRVSYRGETFDGYWALAAALHRALDQGWPLLDARWLAEASDEAVVRLLAGSAPVPLLPKRVAGLREIGRVLLEHYDGQFLVAVRQCAGSASTLTALVARRFSSFWDVSNYEGREVFFFKRAQILVSDLVGAFDGKGPGSFSDLAILTAFADYKLPQMLRAEGVLVYSPDLASIVDARVEMQAGDPREVEIRAATIWGVELLRQQLERLGIGFLAYEVDWLLWEAAQGTSFDHPYHRMRSIYY